MCPSWSECGGYSCINVFKSLEATQLQGSTGVLVSSEHPRLNVCTACSVEANIDSFLKILWTPRAASYFQDEYLLETTQIDFLGHNWHTSQCMMKTGIPKPKRQTVLMRMRLSIAIS